MKTQERGRCWLGNLNCDNKPAMQNRFSTALDHHRPELQQHTRAFIFIIDRDCHRSVWILLHHPPYIKTLWNLKSWSLNPESIAGVKHESGYYIIFRRKQGRKHCSERMYTFLQTSLLSHYWNSKRNLPCRICVTTIHSLLWLILFESSTQLKNLHSLLISAGRVMCRVTLSGPKNYGGSQEWSLLCIVNVDLKWDAM